MGRRQRHGHRLAGQRAQLVGVDGVEGDVARNGRRGRARLEFNPRLGHIEPGGNLRVRQVHLRYQHQLLTLQCKCPPPVIGWTAHRVVGAGNVQFDQDVAVVDAQATDEDPIAQGLGAHRFGVAVLVEHRRQVVEGAGSAGVGHEDDGGIGGAIAVQVAEEAIGGQADPQLDG